ncbi:MAG: hypothetical protein ACOY3D_02930 [Candidatus Omnitrophota bacterium]
MCIPDLSQENLKLLLDSVKYKGGIVTGGDCGAGCKYCYLRESRGMFPFVPLNIPFISKNDFRKALVVAGRHNIPVVTLGDGVDLISSEPFIHPLIYEFIAELEKSRFIRQITITTNGLYIKKEQYSFLHRCKKIRWLLSCSSLNEQGRSRVVAQSNCNSLLSFLGFLHANCRQSVGNLQLVVYDLEYFAKDLAIIKNSFPRFLPFLYVRVLAYNRFFSQAAKAVINHTRKEFRKVLKYCLKRKVSFVWDDSNLDEDYDLKYRFDCFRYTLAELVRGINTSVARCVRNGFKAPLFCLSDSCFFALPRVAGRIILPKLQKRYLRIKNRTFGGNYRCYGLLTLEDFDWALKSADLRSRDVVVMNHIFLNRDGCDLRRRHISELRKKVQIPLMII